MIYIGHAIHSFTNKSYVIINNNLFQGPGRQEELR